MAIIKNSAERAARVEQKKRLIMRFLLTEIYSTADVLAELIGTTDVRAVTRTARKLEVEGLIVGEQIETDFRKLVLFGITSHGVAMTLRDGEQATDRVFEKGRVATTQIWHKLDLQRLRIRAARAGWKGWQSADAISPSARANADVRAKAYKRPDATVLHPGGKRLAIECERHIKSRKRYVAIIESHLASIETGAFAMAVWTCPTPELATALARVLDGIEYVRVRGVSTKIDETKRALLRVTYHDVLVKVEL